MIWNYRIVKRKFKGKTYYGLHEAYSNNKRSKKPHSITKESLVDYYPSIKELQDTLKQMYLDSILNPKPLNYTDF